MEKAKQLVADAAVAVDKAAAAIVSTLGLDFTDEDTKRELEEGPARYAAYLRRITQLFLVKGRLIAYTSDIGESVRPVVPASVVRLAYGITWAYVGVDVVYNTCEEKAKGSPPMAVLRTGVHALTFQSIASVLVPSVIIHQVVHSADNLTKRFPKFMAGGMVARWLPSLVGLAFIPLMPFIDEPVEHLIDKGFDKAWPKADAPPEGEKKKH